MATINSHTVLGLDDLDPENLDYSEFIRFVKKNGITIKEVEESLDNAVNSARLVSKKNNGLIHKKYYYAAIGLLVSKRLTKIRKTS